jgi:transcriptional regulator with XRE-family HTH domain
MSNEEISAGRPNALESLRRLRNRLEIEKPAFRTASKLERRADRFDERMRLELKSRRKRLKWEQKELGARLGYSQSAISKLESGQAELSLKALYRMADAMGLHPIIAFVPAVRPHAESEPGAATGEPTPAEEAARAIEEAQVVAIQQVAEAMMPMTELVVAASDEKRDAQLAIATT